MDASTHIYEIALSILLRGKMRLLHEWLNQYKTAQAVWEKINVPDKNVHWQRAQREIEWINEHDVHVWTQSDDTYPYRLRQCPDSPLVLYGKGNIDLSDGYMLSIVGTRRPTQQGVETTEALVRDLQNKLNKLTIISGGAYGIDIAAHRAAIKYGVPTIIVPAHGLDRIYPSIHRPVAIAALEHGGVLTEYISGTEPLQQHFVQRNRIVAGLADAVVVVESQTKGGSLITARIAQDYNRDVFAFPGRPTDTLSTGCNRLIRTNSAQLIQSADELIESMAWTTKYSPQPDRQTVLIDLYDDITPAQKTILQHLQQAEDGMHINLLVMRMEMNYSELASELIMLEMQGMVNALPGGIYRIVR